jgi:hypothetical protein
MCYSLWWFDYDQDIVGYIGGWFYLLGGSGCIFGWFICDACSFTFLPGYVLNWWWWL